MKSNILYLFTRTPLHLGAGSSVGAIDQPVQRERHTGFPIIPGSSIKGVMRDFFDVPKTGDHLFGLDIDGDDKQGRSGILTFGEAKLLLFPVRSARGGYALATCPLALARYSRDAELAIELPRAVESGNCLAGDQLLIQAESPGCVLEEYAFENIDTFPTQWAEHLSSIMKEDPVLGCALNRYALLSDEDYSYFAQHACQVHQHVKINPETGTVDGRQLFNTETVPSEALFYSLVTETKRARQHSDAISEFKSKLTKETLIQFGGNATTGLGFCSTRLYEKEAS